MLAWSYFYRQHEYWNTDWVCYSNKVKETTGSSFIQQTYLCRVNIFLLLLLLPGSSFPSKGNVSYGQAAKTHHWLAAVSMETAASVPSWEGRVNEHETIHINCSLILLFFISMPLWILDYKYAGNWGRRRFSGLKFHWSADVLWNETSFTHYTRHIKKTHSGCWIYCYTVFPILSIYLYDSRNTPYELASKY